MNEFIKEYLTGIGFEIINILISKGYKQFAGESKPYQIELSRIVNLSIETYQSRYPEHSNGKIWFYQSDVFIKQLLKYRFKIPLDSEKLKDLLKNNPQIVNPSSSEIEEFLEIFDENLNDSTTLEALHIEENYKDTIFHIASGLDALNDRFDRFLTETKNSIQNLHVHNALASEWKRELEIIKDLLYCFKPFTALKLVVQLEQAMKQHEVRDNSLKAQLLYLRARAMEDQGGDGSLQEDYAILYLQAYNLMPENIDYHRHAALGYLILDDFEKADNLANDLIQINEYDTIGWTVLLRRSKNPMDFIRSVPKGVLRQKEFRINAFNFFILNPEHYKVIHCKDSLIKFSDNEFSPQSISYSNFKYWFLFSNYLFSKIYYEFPILSNRAKSAELKNSADFQKYFDLLGKLISAIRESEVIEILHAISFNYHYTKLIITEDVSEVHHVFREYKGIKNRNYVQVIQVVQSLNLLDKREDRENALKVIDEFDDEHELIALFKTTILLDLKRDDEAIDNYEHFVLGRKLGTIHMNNLLEYFRASYGNRKERALKFLSKLKVQNTFPNEAMALLLEMYVKALYQTGYQVAEDDSCFDTIEQGFDERYPEIKQFYITVLKKLGLHNRIITFLRSTVQFDKISDNLLTYCQALYFGDGGKIELLNILELTRRWDQPSDILLKVEIDLREKQRSWDLVLELAEFAISFYPNNSNFIISFYYACIKTLNTEKIVLNKHLGNRISFTEEGCLIVYQAYFQSSLYNEAVEMLYSTASVRGNTRSRQEYIMSIIRFPDEVFKRLEKVVSGSYVTYTIDEEVQDPVYIEETGGNPMIKFFLNRQEGESFIFFNNFTFQNLSIRIEKISNKYGALLDEIKKEALNPLSGLKLREVPYTGGTAEENIENLKKEFGAIGSADEKLRIENLKKYHSGELTFTEIVRANFRSNPLDSYYVLTNQVSGYFQTLPSNLAHIDLLPETKIVLDFSSIPLFYELEKNDVVKFSNHFIVSGYVKYQLLRLLDEALTEPEKKMTLSITTESVVPFFFSENYKEDRIKHLQSLVKWVNDNCSFDTVDEKLDILLNDPEEDFSDDYLQYMYDNRILSLRDDYLLVTNDLMYFKGFGSSFERIIGPEKFIKHFFPELNIKDYLLSHNYVGIDIGHEDLIREFTAFIIGKENNYYAVIENIKPARHNYNTSTIKEVVLFVKWLFINSIFEEGIRYRSIYFILSSLLEGFNDNLLRYMLQTLETEFRLLPDYYTQVMMILRELAMEKANKINESQF